MNAIDVVQAATAAINAGRIEEALSYYHDDVIQRSPNPHGAGFRIRRGKQALRDVLEADIHGGTKAQFRHIRLIEEGDTVAVEGVNVGYFHGHRVEQPVALFFEIHNRRIRQVTIYYDRLGLQRAMERGAT